MVTNTMRDTSILTWKNFLNYIQELGLLNTLINEGVATSIYVLGDLRVQFEVIDQPTKKSLRTTLSQPYMEDIVFLDMTELSDNVWLYDKVICPMELQGIIEQIEDYISCVLPKF